MSLIVGIEQCRFIKIGGGGFEFAATIVSIGAGENIRRFFRIQFDGFRIRLDSIFKISGTERFAPHKKFIVGVLRVALDGVTKLLDGVQMIVFFAGN